MAIRAKSSVLLCNFIYYQAALVFLVGSSVVGLGSERVNIFCIVVYITLMFNFNDFNSRLNYLNIRFSSV
jgi:hypothetical protein